MRYLKDKYFYWKLKEFFLWNEGKNQKYSIWKSIFSIVSLKFLAFKKKSHNLNCFVSPTEQSCAYHIIYNSDVI